LSAQAAAIRTSADASRRRLQSSWEDTMTHLEQLEAIKTNTLAQMAEVSAERKPSYSEAGQSFSWTEYLEHLQRRVDWCNAQLAVEAPFEFPSQGYSP
jgi:hypothetical protein